MNDDRKMSENQKIAKLERPNNLNKCENHNFFGTEHRMKRNRNAEQHKKSHGKITISNGLSESNNEKSGT